MLPDSNQTSNVDFLITLLPALAVVGSAISFILWGWQKQRLENEKLKIEIEKLRRELDSKIYIPDTAEINEILRVHGRVFPSQDLINTGNSVFRNDLSRLSEFRNSKQSAQLALEVSRAIPILARILLIEHLEDLLCEIYEHHPNEEDDFPLKRLIYQIYSLLNGLIEEDNSIDRKWLVRRIRYHWEEVMTYPVNESRFDHILETLRSEYANGLVEIILNDGRRKLDDL